MTIEEIRKNAPEGAVRYDDENCSCLTYFKKTGITWCWWTEKHPQWVEYELVFVSESDLIDLTKPLYH